MTRFTMARSARLGVDRGSGVLCMEYCGSGDESFMIHKVRDELTKTLVDAASV